MRNFTPSDGTISVLLGASLVAMFFGSERIFWTLTVLVLVRTLFCRCSIRRCGPWPSLPARGLYPQDKIVGGGYYAVWKPRGCTRIDGANGSRHYSRGCLPAPRNGDSRKLSPVQETILIERIGKYLPSTATLRLAKGSSH